MQISGGKLDYGDRNLKNKKISKIIMILIILIFVVMISIICVIIYIQQNMLKIYVDGVSVNVPERNNYSR